MAEPPFVPKPGQVDYTHIRYAPVVNTVIAHNGKVLLVQRSKEMRLYPGFWSGISGFLDDDRSIEDKVREELQEEGGIAATDIISMERGQPLLQEAPDYHKTWLVVPVLVCLKRKEFTLNWESHDAKWYELAQTEQLNVLPGYHEVLAQFVEQLQVAL